MFVCNECGSDSLMIRAWIDPNTDKIIADIDADTAWCNMCQKEVRMDIDNKLFSINHKKNKNKTKNKK